MLCKYLHHILYLECGFIVAYCLWLHVNIVHNIAGSNTTYQHRITAIGVRRQASFSGVLLDFHSRLV